MKLFFLFGFSFFFLASCSDNKNNSGTSSSDSATSVQENAAADSSVTNTNSTSSSSTANATFKEVMDKMMKDMNSMQMTQDPDHDFAIMMKRHHQGAIDMSNIEISKGTNAEMKQVAQKTIEDSQKDINDLNNFLGSNQPTKKSDFGQKQMDKMMKSMNMDMEMGGDTDKEFAMMMSMHHQHGIDMARDYLKVATAEETKKVANNTIKSNSEGIKKLKALSGNTADHSGRDMSQKDAGKKSTSKKETPKTDHSGHQ